jgi:hypothetical protein
MSMKEYGRETAVGVGMATQVVIWGFVLIAGFSLISYAGYAFFAPRYEQVRYDTFKQSQAYNDGMIRDLQELKRDYIAANDEQKIALKALTIHRFEVYDINRLPSDLQSFYYSLGH